MALGCVVDSDVWGLLIEKTHTVVAVGLVVGGTLENLRKAYITKLSYPTQLD